MNKTTYPSDVAFSPSVKAVQARKGSRATYARMESGRGWQTRITEGLAEFIAAQNSVFLATASAQGQPYIQHRGGSPGFLRVLGETMIAFADFVGNRQYISLGNLAENPKAQLFLMDYEQQQRVKIWGEARVVEDDPDLVASLMPQGYDARAEQAVLFKVLAWDANCPQHIPRRFEADDLMQAIASRDRRIADLESELRKLKSV